MSGTTAQTDVLAFSRDETFILFPTPRFTNAQCFQILYNDMQTMVNAISILRCYWVWFLPTIPVAFSLLSEGLAM